MDTPPEAQSCPRAEWVKAPTLGIKLQAQPSYRVSGHEVA